MHKLFMAFIHEKGGWITESTVLKVVRRIMTMTPYGHTAWSVQYVMQAGHIIVCVSVYIDNSKNAFPKYESTLLPLMMSRKPSDGLVLDGYKVRSGRSNFTEHVKKITRDWL